MIFDYYSAAIILLSFFDFIGKNKSITVQNVWEVKLKTIIEYFAQSYNSVVNAKGI